jgi:nitric oxide reductase subunit B
MRLPGDVVFAAGALLMAWDFIVKLGPLYPRVARRLQIPVLQQYEQPAE